MAASDRSPRVAQRRQRILGAAALCFAKDGFARTRIDDVAASAGVSRALVYNHFGSKEELARRVCDHLLDDWSSAVVFVFSSPRFQFSARWCANRAMSSR